MKKFITTLLIVFMVAPMFVFAATPEPEVSDPDISVNINESINPAFNERFGIVGSYQMPLTARAKSMGGAGIAFPGRADSFFLNPAGFAKRVGVYLPSAEVTLYHPYDLLNAENGESIVDGLIKASKIQDPDERQKALMASATKVLGVIKSGRGKLLDVNASVGFNILGFAFGVNVQDSVHTFGENLGGMEGYLFDELNVTANVGLGLRFHLGDKAWIDAGANWRPTYKAYSGLVGIDTVSNAIGSSDQNSNPADIFMKKLSVAAGYALPFDVGLNISGSWWSVGVVGRNILGTFKMTNFENLETFAPAWSSVFGNKDFEIKTPWSIDLGIGLKWDNAFFKPTFVCDIVDINTMFTAEKFDAREFVSHLKAGAELRLLSFLDVRGGFNQGYWSVGAGLDLAIVKVDVAYFWQEFGDKLGDIPLDGLSVRVNVGYDR